MKKTISFIILFAMPMLLAQSAFAQDIFDAVRSGDLAKVKELVEKDPKLVKARNANQSTPLHVAVDVNNEPIAKYLIEKGAELNAVNRYNWTPLLYAKGKATVNLLIGKGADINQGIGHGNALRQFMQINHHKSSLSLPGNIWVSPSPGRGKKRFRLPLESYRVNIISKAPWPSLLMGMNCTGTLMTMDTL